MTQFSDLVGKTLVSIMADVGDYVVHFMDSEGTKYVMYHDQDCCENVAVEDICGDLNDLLHSPILVAEESTSGENPEGVSMGYQDSFTWTFYKLDTAKGGVTIRWYGQSNGYYSERVSFRKEERHAL